jgi:hypothetical protein
MNFTQWLEEADMPEFVNGQWIDLETGIPYTPSSAVSRAVLSIKAQNARVVAKTFGGKALKGTAKQKEWAEKIRAEKLTQMTAEQAEMACDPNGLLTAAKFWIGNRDVTGRAIGEFVQQQKSLLKRARTLKARGATAEYAAVAAQYNALTKQWGWES